MSAHPCSEQFNYEARSESKRDSEPVLFFGEMVFPFMVEDYEEVRVREKRSHEALRISRQS